MASFRPLEDKETVIRERKAHFNSDGFCHGQNYPGSGIKARLITKTVMDKADRPDN